MSDRLSCCVPFCNRSCRNDKNYSEFLCAKHWPTVPCHLRRRHSKMARMRRRLFGDNSYWTYKAGSPERLKCVRLDRICGKAWAQCKVAAIERAAGI